MLGIGGGNGTGIAIGITIGAGAIAAPTNTVLPGITGTAQQGQTLTCSTGTWTGSPTSYSYQWKSAGSNVGTNQNTYVPVIGDVGNTITCVVTATNAGGSTSATSPATGTVIAAPTAPTVTGLNVAGGFPAGGSTVTLTGTSFTGATAVHFGATSASFSVVNDTTITATDPGGSSGTTVDVTVTTPAGTSATSAADKYFWLHSPTNYWKLNEGTGATTYVDQMGVKSLTKTGTVTQVTGIVDFASTPSLNGGVKATSIPAGMKPGSGSWSCACWVKVSSFGSVQTFIEYGTVNQTGFSLIANSGGWFIITRVSNQAFSQATSTHNQTTATWHLVAAKFDGSDLYLSIDGENWEAGVAASAGAADTVFSLMFNGTSGSSQQTAQCETRYDVGYVYTNAELSLLYNSGAGWTCNGTNYLV